MFQLAYQPACPSESLFRLTSLSVHPSVCLFVPKYRKSLQFAVFLGKGKPANCEIRELRGMFSMKTLKLGKMIFKVHILAELITNNS